MAGTVSAQATAAIKHYGAAGTLKQSVPGVFNPATGTTTPTVTTCAVSAVLDGSSQKGLGFKFGEGLVKAGDLKALIGAKGLTFTPAPGNDLTVGTITYKVIAAMPTYVMGQPVTWDLLVRR